MTQSGGATSFLCIARSAISVQISFNVSAAIQHVFPDVPWLGLANPIPSVLFLHHAKKVGGLHINRGP